MLQRFDVVELPQSGTHYAQSDDDIVCWRERLEPPTVDRSEPAEKRERDSGFN